MNELPAVAHGVLKSSSLHQLSSTYRGFYCGRLNSGNIFALSTLLGFTVPQSNQRPQLAAQKQNTEWNGIQHTLSSSRGYWKFPVQIDEGNMNGNKLLHLMRPLVHANFQNYLCLLDAYFASGSLIEAKRIHCTILKSGLDKEHVLCERLIDIYFSQGYLELAVKVFDFVSYDIYFWNKIINGFVVTKQFPSQVLSLFRRIIVANISPNETTFVGVLRACHGGNIPLIYIEQIYSKIICYGLNRSMVVCNLLIDLYSKNGYVDSAVKVFDDITTKDSVSWVAMISGFSQNGLEKDAILLFFKMYSDKNSPTPYVLSSVISACMKIELFDLGEQLHGLVFKCGFASETYVGNALVTLYCRSGNLVSSEKVFRSMCFKDSVSYNSLISGLAQHGFSDKALELFKKMQLDCLKLDCVTVASLLNACAAIGSLYKGRQLHSFAIKAGMSSDIILEGSLLDLYVKCADIQTAHEFFCTTKTENVVLWNVMLVAYGQLNSLSESLDIFWQMQIKGMRPNQFTYPSILRTCVSLGDLNLGEQIHSQVIRSGFQSNGYVCSGLIDMYAKHGELVHAMKILKRLDDDDVVSWTAMIAGYVQHDMFTEALKIFQEMKSRRIRSDNIGFLSAIGACVGLRALNQGRQIQAQSYVSGFLDDLSIGNALISLYARCGRVQEAYLAFDKLAYKDNISWNGLISGFAQSGYSEEALQIFTQMTKTEEKANLFTFGSAISAAANIADIKQGQQIHAMVLKTGYNIETEAANALITLYAKCGNIDDAKREFDEMSEKNEVSWNALITAYSQHGYGIEALKFYEEMKQHGVMPNLVTYLGVLSACSHVGLVKDGLDYFESMRKVHGLVPKVEHYVCIVDLLGRAGLLNRAKGVVEEMPIAPDAMIWRTLLSASIIHKNLKIGEFAASHLLELEPDDSATYVLVSNIYAVSGNWELRDQTRKIMKNRGVKKEPGRSWIEVKNKVHAFYVGDRLHPLTDLIYKFFGYLNERAVKIGYAQDRSNLLNDAEQGQKDLTIHIHSEKLAIAYGLLSLYNNVPLRVMKNLRVCHDCHSWIKYVSKVTNRTIIVRDCHRFHHFEDGVCSCRDYW